MINFRIVKQNDGDTSRFMVQRQFCWVWLTVHSLKHIKWFPTIDHARNYINSFETTVDYKNTVVEQRVIY